MNKYACLFTLLILLILGCYGSALTLSGPAFLTPVIDGKSKLSVLIPGKDSLLFSVPNVPVAGWRISRAPIHGTATLTGADSMQVWVRFEQSSGNYSLDTLTLEATGSTGLVSARNIIITSYDNVYQYEGELLMDKIRLQFFNPRTGLYAEKIRADGILIQGNSYLWPASHLMRAFKNANRINPAKYEAVLKSYTRAIDQYISTSGNKVGYSAYPGDTGRFYDDNGLLIIQFAEIYKDLKDIKILDQAKIAYHFNNADRDANLGLPQHENQLGQGIFYSMAVNQTGLGAALLYEITGEAGYLEDAKAYYVQLRNSNVKLMDAQYHLFQGMSFFQNGEWSLSGIMDGQPIDGRGFRAYQTTHVVQHALKLYQITGEGSCLNQARDMLEACIRYWYIENHGLSEISFWGGDDLIDALVDFYEATGEKRYFDVARNIVDFLIEFGKDSRGYYPSDYDDKFGRWNLDQRGNAPATYLMMGEAAAASAILRVAKVKSTLTAVDQTEPVHSGLNTIRIFPSIIAPGETLTIQFDEQENQDIQICIFSMDGRALFKRTLKVTGNSSSFPMPSLLLTTGMVIVKLTVGNRGTTHRLLLSDSR